MLLMLSLIRFVWFPLFGRVQRVTCPTQPNAPSWCKSTQGRDFATTQSINNNSHRKKERKETREEESEQQGNRGNEARRWNTESVCVCHIHSFDDSLHKVARAVRKFPFLDNRRTDHDEPFQIKRQTRFPHFLLSTSTSVGPSQRELTTPLREDNHIEALS